MSVKIIDTLKPKNNGSFPIVEAVDVAVTADIRLPEALAEKADASALAATDAAVATKVDASEFAASTAELQGEIDQIVISASSEAVVAPEVAQARVTEDGTSYSTLKERLDSENSIISDEIAGIENISGVELNITSHLEINDGYYVSGSNGTRTASQPDFSYTTFYNVEGYSRIRITMPKITADSTAMGIAFYSANNQDTFISGAFVTRKQSQTGYETREFTIPEGAKYFRSSWFSSNGAYASFYDNFSCTVYRDAEIQNARIGTDGTVYSALKLRLDTEIGAISSDINSAQTGTDGTSYSTLKERLDTENHNLSDEISAIEDISGIINEIADKVTFNNGSFVQASNGALAGSQPDFSYTSFYSIDGYDKIKLTMPKIMAATTSMGIAFYSSDDVSSFISGSFVTRNQTEMGYETREFEIPEGAKYFRSPWFSSNGAYAAFYSAYECTLYKYGVVGNIELEITALTEGDITGETEAGYIRAATGEVLVSNSYICTKYIPVSSGMNYYYSGRLVSSSSVAGYDENGIFVENLLAPDASTDYIDQLLTIPSQVKFIKACKLASSSIPLKVVAKGDTIQSLQSQTAGILNSILMPEGDQLTSISMFERIGILGDSFSSGAIYSIEGAVSGAHYGISWGSILGRMNGITCKSYASPGVNTEDYIINSHCLPALLDDTACNLYLVMLGINPDTTIGEITDINDADYTQNPNTFYGNMGRIYEQVMAHAPNAKIILIVPPLGTSETHTAIIDIANHYSIPVFKTLDDQFYHSRLYQDYKGQGHPVGVTYAGMAKAMRRQVEKCMADNITYFLDYTGND